MRQKLAIVAARFCVVHDFACKRLVLKEIFRTMSAPMLLRLWLVFAQAATLAVAVLFVVSTFRPEWLPTRSGTPVAVVQTAPPPSSGGLRAASYSAGSMP